MSDCGYQRVHGQMLFGFSMPLLTLKKAHLDFEKITYYFTFIRGILFIYDFDLHDGGRTPFAKMGLNIKKNGAPNIPKIMENFYETYSIRDFDLHDGCCTRLRQE
jgi:hypothetical protein